MSNDPAFAVIFDIDGVLIDSIPLHLRAFDKALAQYGVKISQLSHDHRASSIKDLAKSINDELGVYIRDVSEFSNQIDGCILDELDEISSADPGLVSLLTDLEKRNVPCALGTSAVRKMAELKVSKLGIDKYFKGLVGAEDVIRHKPFPDVYLACAELLDVPAEKCVVIEDAKSGIEAGKKAGMKTVGFVKYSPDRLSLREADIIAKNWNQLDYHVLGSLIKNKKPLYLE